MSDSVPEISNYRNTLGALAKLHILADSTASSTRQNVSAIPHDFLFTVHGNLPSLFIAQAASTLK